MKEMSFDRHSNESVWERFDYLCGLPFPQRLEKEVLHELHGNADSLVGDHYLGQYSRPTASTMMDFMHTSLVNGVFHFQPRKPKDFLNQRYMFFFAKWRWPKMGKIPPKSFNETNDKRGVENRYCRVFLDVSGLSEVSGNRCVCSCVSQPKGMFLCPLPVSRLI